MSEKAGAKPGGFAPKGAIAPPLLPGAPKNTANVRFNVGGKVYETSRSLLERPQHKSTMLARLVSETWQKDPSSSVFIDRDGEHFRFVLHYLRYGNVTLPLGGSFTKEALLQDMDFYGIDVAEGSVSMSGSDLKAYHCMTMDVDASYHDRIKAFEAKKEALDKQKEEVILQKNCAIVAYECFKQYSQQCRGGGPFMVQPLTMQNLGLENVGRSRVKLDDYFAKDYFKECLAGYALRCVKTRGDDGKVDEGTILERIAPHDAKTTFTFGF